MEKDFLGISRTVSGPDDSRGNRVDSAFPVGSAARRSYTNQPSSLQQFIPFKSTQLDEKPKPSFQPVSTAGSNTKPCAVQDPQISFCIDRNNVQQVSIHASTYLAPVSQASAPNAMNSPFFKVHGSCNAPNITCTAIKPQPFRSPIPNNSSLFGAGVGSFTPWKVVRPPPTTRQLTIFYAGSVNVYDDVPWDKAQAIMHMAREACKASTFDDPTVAQSSSLVNKHVMAPSPVLSSTLPLASQRRNQSGCCSMTIDVQEIVQRAGTTVSASEDDPSKTMTTSMVAAIAAKILPRAVPQARKASLARFLEKRKERVSNTVPYYADKKPSDNSAGPDATAASSSSAAPPDFRTRNREFSLFRGQAKYSDDNNDSPSTNLEM